MKQVEPNTQNIEQGDEVMVIFAWSESPSDKNFHFGTVENVYYTELSNCHLLKFKVSGLDREVPADRIRLIEKGNLKAFPKFVCLSEIKCESISEYSDEKGFRFAIVANNFDRTEFEVLSAGDTYKIKLKFSDNSNDVFGSCSCMDFKVRNHVCKHLAFVGMKEVYQRYAAAA